MKKLFALLLTVCLLALSALPVMADAAEVTTVGYSADRITAVDLDDVYNIKHCEELLTHYPEYKITDADGLKLLSTLVNSGDAFSGVTVYLANDIDMTDVTGFLPIGKGNFAFQGTFDGQGHAINNLKMTLDNDYFYMDGSSQKAPIGLFGCVAQSGTVKNLIMGEGCEIKCDGSGLIWETYVGAIAGMLKTGAVIDNCYNMAKVSGGKATGGIAGYGSNGDHIIKNCTNVGTLSFKEGTNWTKESGGQCTIGGILGTHQMGTTIVKNCRNAGTINGFGYSAGFGGAGGIVGRSAALNMTIEGCINNGAINGGGNTTTSHSIAGGILGYGQFDTTIKNCLNYGALTAEEGGTGIVGMRFINSNTQALPTITQENNEDKSLADPAETDATLEAALLGELTYNYEPNEGNALIPPELIEDDKTDEGDTTAKKPDTTAKKPDTTTAPSTEAPTEEPTTEKKGCGSTVGGFAVILLTVGAAVVGLKKKED